MYFPVLAVLKTVSFCLSPFHPPLNSQARLTSRLDIVFVLFTLSSHPCQEMSEEAQQTPLQIYSASCESRRCKPNAVIVARIASAAAENIKEIDLTKPPNLVGDKGLLCIAEFARECAVQSLVVRHLFVRNHTAVTLSGMLLGHPTLRHLDLSGNPLSMPTAKALKDLVRKTPSLISVCLDDTLIARPHVAEIQRFAECNASRPFFGALGASEESARKAIVLAETSGWGLSFGGLSQGAGI